MRADPSCSFGAGADLPVRIQFASASAANAWRLGRGSWKPRLTGGFLRPRRPTAEDRLYGRDKQGDELPDWVADKKRRAAKIRAAKAELAVLDAGDPQGARRMGARVHRAQPAEAGPGEESVCSKGNAAPSRVRTCLRPRPAASDPHSHHNAPLLRHITRTKWTHS